MEAYNNDPKLKDDLLTGAIENERLDRYIVGTYGDTDSGDFKGCSLGCTIHDYNKLTGRSVYSGDHQALAAALDIPLFITLMQDYIFEGLPSDLRYAWTHRFLSAIPVGADLSLVRDEFLNVFGLTRAYAYVDAVAAAAAAADAADEYTDYADTLVKLMGECK